MAQSKCPDCGCMQLYVKNPIDEYDIYEFECRDGKVCFEDNLDADECPACVRPSGYFELFSQNY